MTLLWQLKTPLIIITITNIFFVSVIFTISIKKIYKLPNVLTENIPLFLSPKTFTKTKTMCFCSPDFELSLYFVVN